MKVKITFPNWKTVNARLNDKEFNEGKKSVIEPELLKLIKRWDIVDMARDFWVNAASISLIINWKRSWPEDLVGLIKEYLMKKYL